jgi:hypothetical protein
LTQTFGQRCSLMAIAVASSGAVKATVAHFRLDSPENALPWSDVAET